MNINEIVKDGFRFLIDEFGCRIVLDDAKGFKLVYQNKTTTVIVRFDERDFALFVFIGRSDERIGDGLDKWYYDLGDIVVGKNKLLEGEWQRNDYNYENVVKQYAYYIKTYAADIMKGDFSSLKLAQMEVNKREAAYQKWLSEPTKPDSR